MNCDIFFISYDEPRAEDSWHKIRDVFPQSQRIHGIKGFDAAYKACARSAQSPRFFTIDGDNEILPTFTQLHLDLANAPTDCVLSWSAKNSINGLAYGNGGIKNWPKAIASEMRTHESSSSVSGAVDFCFELKYLQMPETLSIANIHGSSFQAFRAGFREGVKLCLERGVRPPLGMPLQNHIWHENLKRLKIWCSVGIDIENGKWAIYGARLGCKMLCLTNWNYQSISDYDWFNSFWQNQQQTALDPALQELENELNSQLDLGIVTLCNRDSRFFKSVYQNPPRQGLMYK